MNRIMDPNGKKSNNVLKKNLLGKINCLTPNTLYGFCEAVAGQGAIAPGIRKATKIATAWSANMRMDLLKIFLSLKNSHNETKPKKNTFRKEAVERREFKNIIGRFIYRYLTSFSSINR